MPYYGITAKITVAEKEIAYISNWSIEETRDIVEVTQLGVDTKDKKPTLYSWTGSADGTADFETVPSGDTRSNQLALRAAMVNGTPVSVKFYLSDTRYLEGSAYIESMSLDVAAEDKANISISLTGIGKLEMKPDATPAV